MSETRDDPFDLSSFMPARQPTPPVNTEAVRRAGEELGYVDRSPKPPSVPPVAAPLSPRAMRRYRTGRNQQINIKATGEVIARLTRLSDDYHWPLGETLEYALDALEKKLAR